LAGTGAAEVQHFFNYKRFLKKKLQIKSITRQTIKNSPLRPADSNAGMGANYLRYFLTKCLSVSSIEFYSIF
jgi:hypothetical protein